MPEPGDPVLFTTSGMHPLTRYLLGEPHPRGPRLVGIQRCLRTTDLEEVGDRTLLTAFQMLGNWSLGDCDAAARRSRGDCDAAAWTRTTTATCTRRTDCRANSSTTY